MLLFLQESEQQRLLAAAQGPGKWDESIEGNRRGFEIGPGKGYKGIMS